MAKKKSLGRGLEALMGDTEFIDSFENYTQKDSDIEKIDINLIKPNKLQPRKHFDKAELDALKVSIERNGIIQPIILRRLKKGYEIIAGERRYRASLLAGLEKMPAIIIDVNEAKRYEISLIENMQRSDLNPIEEALAYSSLLETHNITQAEVSEMVGKSRTYITNTIRVMNNCSEKVKDKLISSDISSGHAKVLAGIDKQKQDDILDKIIAEKLSVRELEKLLEESGKTKKKKSTKVKSKFDNEYYEFEEKLTDKYATKVKVSNKTISIEYYSEEDFNRIMKMLLK